MVCYDSGVAVAVAVADAINKENGEDEGGATTNDEKTLRNKNVH
jgi:hypothetical protein